MPLFNPYLTVTDEPVTPIRLIRTADLASWRAALSEAEQRWVQSAGFEARPGQVVWLPDDSGRPARVAAGWDGRDTLESLGGLPLVLPEGVYRVENPVSELQYLGWATGSY
ncbi:MAG TPA: hypothetical protein VF210_02725 [Pseudomonadales bacterium]